jgi:flagellar basal-body rod protein FlgG
MSVQTLYTAATGMDSLQTKLDVIANNLANVNTTGFKRDRANFEDLFYRHEVLPGAQDASGQLTPVGTQIGLGSRVSSTQTDFDQGSFMQSSRQLDVAIEGNGFFRVLDPATSQTLYSRAGNFSINANNQLVMGSAGTGRLLDPPVEIPIDTTGIVISPDGQVSVRQAGQPNLNPVTQIQLSTFINPQGLLKLGENLYSETDASGPPQDGTPGTNGIGVVRQNALEASNVEPVQELIDLITTQRAFELNSQAIQAGDQILQLVANLRRF